MGILKDRLLSKQCRIASNYGLQRFREERVTSELHQRFMNYSKETVGHNKERLQACICSAGGRNVIGKLGT